MVMLPILIDIWQLQSFLTQYCFADRVPVLEFSHHLKMILNEREHEAIIFFSYKCIIYYRSICVKF